MKRLQVINGALYALSIVIIATSLFFAWVFLAPIDVVKDWQLKIEGNNFHPGQTVVIESLYRKTRDVTGTSKRYIECRNGGGVYIRYQLNEAEANRQAGSGGTGIIVTIPQDIPEVTLPTQCRFYIVIDYEVYSFRTVTEKNASRDFTLLPADTHP